MGHRVRGVWEVRQIFFVREELEDFCSRVFQKYGLQGEEALESARVLVAADARNIPSHGVARLRRYMIGFEEKTILPHGEIETLRETPVSLVLDAHGAMGAPVSTRAMKSILEKAEETGMAMGSVRNSNHFGIAGYYAMMALERDMIGVAMTNTAALGVPTFGRQVMFGTNPIAFAAPADEEKGFVLDMATTVVPRGKLEVYEREGKDLPPGWAVDRRGLTGREPAQLLDDMYYRRGGGILPLGGEGELFSGYKGYGLAVVVDICCAMLSGGLFGPHVRDTEKGAGRVCHYFGAFRIDAFRDPREFREDMDHMLRALRETPVAEGQERVYFAGLKEFEAEELAAREGVRVSGKVYEDLEAVAKELDLKLPEVRQEER